MRTRRLGLVCAASSLILACSDDMSSSSGSGTGGATTASTSTVTGSGGTGGQGGAGSATLSLPQFVHGAAYVDKTEMSKIPIVVDFTGTAPDAVTVDVEGTTTDAVSSGDHFVATVDVSALKSGSHAVTATATRGTSAIGTVSASLTSATGSFQFTTFATDGVAYSGQLTHDTVGDSLIHTWISIVDSKHSFSLAHLDGAFARLSTAKDITLNDPADEPLTAHSAISDGGIGVVYRTTKPNDSHWSIKMRVVDPTGAELVPVMDLTGEGSAFSMLTGGADPGGYSAAWLHITPATDPNNPPPLEIRFSRYDTKAKKLLGPITLDLDQPAAKGSSEGPQSLEPLAEMGMACNQSVCLVSYTRDVYNQVVQLNVPKLFIAVVDLTTGKQVGTSQAVSASDWDTQEFGHQLITNPDGTFALVYTANDTAAAVTPKDPCDETLERDLLFAVKIDASGNHPKPKPIFDFEGTREYPRIAVHPEGYALFWEDQRSECEQNGHIRMAANVAAPDFGSLLDTYQEMPGSVGIPPENPSVAVAGTNALASWSDNRDGNGVLDERLEIFFDTHWRP